MLSYYIRFCSVPSTVPELSCFLSATLNSGCVDESSLCFRLVIVSWNEFKWYVDFFPKIWAKKKLWLVIISHLKLNHLLTVICTKGSLVYEFLEIYVSYDYYLKVSENGFKVVLAIRLSCDGAFLAEPAVLLAAEGTDKVARLEQASNRMCNWGIVL